jgi:protein-histidine N-methyltransferase
VADRREAIESDYRNICAAHPPFAGTATLEQFAWARMIVASRNFGIVVRGLRTAALVPYADMLNHR